ncbi:MAG: nucleotide-binding protein [Candidatus Thorarchaeota archaeon]|nr:nucleotide-binding protein [Candidatus Thorarchaeota archaeon]
MQLPLTVIIDTNFLAAPVQAGIDIFKESERILERKIEFQILKSVVKETNRRFARPRDKKERIAFNVAKSLMERCKIVEVPEQFLPLPVDDQILAYAKQVRGIIATNDRDLRQRARRAKIPVLFVRGKKKLELEGYTA